MNTYPGGYSQNSLGQQNQYRPPNPPQQLPPGWYVELFDELHMDPMGRQFFVDTKTGVSHWTLPNVLPPQQPIYQPPAQQPMNPHVQVTKNENFGTALLIGINYTGTRAALAGIVFLCISLIRLLGCHNDVKNVKQFITRTYGYQDNINSMVCLTDDQTNPLFIPTRQNIINAMRWLVQDARPGDSFFFHFSGHGSKQKDKDGDEDDGYDETICPLDYERAGMITDDEMNTIMCRPLPQGCRFVGIFDSCHSGTALDFPYQYTPDGKIKERTAIKNIGGIGKRLLGDLNSGKVFNPTSLFGDIKNALGTENATKKTKETRGTRAYCIMLSGCKDVQTSADTAINGRATGAMTHSLMKCIQNNPSPTFFELLQQ
ncbi:Ca(2+)-dependent cysteine protease [Clydaea vesicula]|uniref:Ca(2+)-dependent cysteine protease n=1 Tax=Clydaea vesicula TaxID=447962 RepID=A0AAD5U9A0_9FUNG|nr:Ca(2+)-dependent cysteine protease [Clydaea vesicula]